LAAVQVALSTALLVIGTGLVRDFALASSVASGLNPMGVLSADVSLSRSRYGGDRSRAYFVELLRRSASIPGVEDAALVSTLPGGRFGAVLMAAVDGGKQQGMAFRFITPQYFSLLSIPVVAGRCFFDREMTSSERVVMVNEAFARRYWGGPAHAIGKSIAAGQVDRPEAYRVIGVSASTREHGILAPEVPEAYWLITAPVASSRSTPLTELTLLLRAHSGRGASLADVLRTVVRGLDPDQPIFNVRTLEQVMFAKLARERLLVLAMALFSVLALVLATVGTYGVLSCEVARRQRGIAVRIALGATRSSAVWAVIHASVALAGLGAAVGVLAASSWLTFVSSEFLTVGSADVPVCAAVGVATASAGVLVALAPAWRAARREPWEALRSE
jgi:hypothetical protein